MEQPPVYNEEFKNSGIQEARRQAAGGGGRAAEGWGQEAAEKTKPARRQILSVHAPICIAEGLGGGRRWCVGVFQKEEYESGLRE